MATTDFNFDSFAVWPNPSTGVYNLSFMPANNETVQVSLYDIRGRLVSNQSFEDVSSSQMFNQSLDYSAANTGLYFLVVENGDKVATKKLIKN